MIIFFLPLFIYLFWCVALSHFVLCVHSHNIHRRHFLLGSGGVEISGCVSSGQTRSQQSVGQNFLILSKRYCCCSNDSPGRGMTGGRSVLVGFQLISWRRFISLSGLVTESLTLTVRESKVMRIPLMPLRAVCLKGCQSILLKS